MGKLILVGGLVVTGFMVAVFNPRLVAIASTFVGRNAEVIDQSAETE